MIIETTKSKETGIGLWKRVTVHLKNVSKVWEETGFQDTRPPYKAEKKTKLYNTISVECAPNEVDKVIQDFKRKYKNINKINVSNCYKNIHYV